MSAIYRVRPLCSLTNTPFLVPALATSQLFHLALFLSFSKVQEKQGWLEELASSQSSSTKQNIGQRTWWPDIRLAFILFANVPKMGCNMCSVSFKYCYSQHCEDQLHKELLKISDNSADVALWQLIYFYLQVELTTIQKKLYRAILERNFAFLSKGATSSANVPNLMNTMMELRKCCNHPFLITGAEEKVLAEHNLSMHEKTPKHATVMIDASGKLVLIHKLLPKLKANGHKVLVFSQMVRCLDILEDYLVHMRYPYERIDGRVRGNLRQAAIDRFSKPDSDRFVFLLCTRAGGLGINLTAADTVIIFDSDWNPQNDIQAQARCHRIGQSRSVKVYRLITRNSYEREMFDRASMKLGLDKAVLQSMNTKENASNNVRALFTLRFYYLIHW